MARYGIRNYNAALREIRAQTGASLAAARETWRTMRDRSGSAPTGADVRRASHRALQRDANRAEKHVQAESRREARREARERRAAEKPARPVEAPRAISRVEKLQREANQIGSIGEWRRFVERYGGPDLDWGDFEASEDPILYEPES